MNAKKWGDLAEYKAHLQRVPAVIPYLPLPADAVFALPAAVVCVGVLL